MEDWSKRPDLFLMADDREVLQDAGKITAEIAKSKAETEFENGASQRVLEKSGFMATGIIGTQGPRFVWSH